MCCVCMFVCVLCVYVCVSVHVVCVLYFSISSAILFSALLNYDKAQLKLSNVNQP